MKRTTLAVLAILLTMGPGTAQQLELGGQLRPRFEIRDPVAGLPTGVERLTLTTMRTRAFVRAALAGATVMVQFQDVRAWGSEAGTLDGSAEALDLHQGWIELGDPESEDWAVRVGRQELIYGGERLVGAVNWSQQGRSFDGVRLRVRPADGFVVDGLAMQIGDADAGGPRDEALYGLYGRYEPVSLDGYLLFNTFDSAPGPGAPIDLTDQYTLGARWEAARGGYRWRIEGAYQLGERLQRDISAYLFAFRVGREIVPDLDATFWYDHLSGDDDLFDGEIRYFDTLFATNHTFYGHMDLFVNIPVQTAGLGLEDLALKTRYEVSERLALTGDAHAFFLAASEGLTSSHVGEELDLAVHLEHAPGISLSAGLSVFLAGEAWSDVLLRADENQLWGYLMLDATF